MRETKSTFETLEVWMRGFFNIDNLNNYKSEISERSKRRGSEVSKVSG